MPHLQQTFANESPSNFVVILLWAALQCNQELYDPICPSCLKKCEELHSSLAMAHVRPFEVPVVIVINDTFLKETRKKEEDV